MNMEFTIEFYVTAEGRCPVQQFLDALRRTDPDDFAIVVAGLDRLRNRAYHRPPLSKSIGDRLFELRHVGKLNTRVFYFLHQVDASSRCTGFAIRQQPFHPALAKPP